MFECNVILASPRTLFIYARAGAVCSGWLNHRNTSGADGTLEQCQSSNEAKHELSHGPQKYNGGWRRS